VLLSLPTFIPQALLVLVKFDYLLGTVICKTPVSVRPPLPNLSTIRTSRSHRFGRPLNIVNLHLSSTSFRVSSYILPGFWFTYSFPGWALPCFVHCFSALTSILFRASPGMFQIPRWVPMIVLSFFQLPRVPSVGPSAVCNVLQYLHLYDYFGDLVVPSCINPH